VHSLTQIRAHAEIERRSRAKSELERQHQIQTAPPTLSPFRRFQNQYRDARAAFARDCIRWSAGRGLAPYQEEALCEIDVTARYALRGPRGLGKTTIGAIIVLHWALCHDEVFDWKAVTTASLWRQLTKFLWPEIHKWARRLRWEKIGREGFARLQLLALQVSLSTGQAFPAASDNPETLEGAHAEALLYLFDESKIIPPATWDATEGAFSNAGTDGMIAKWVAISSPGEPSGRFYEIHQRKPGTEDWKVRHVTLEECIAAGRISKSWAEQREKQWGKDSALYQNHVLGEFASDQETGLIPLAWVEAAMSRYEEWQDEINAMLEDVPAHARAAKRVEIMGNPDVLAADIADGGSDPGALGRRYGYRVDTLEYLHGADTMEIAGRIVQGVKFHKPTRVVGDADGVGAGTIRRVREQEIEIDAYHGNDSAEDLTDRSGELEFNNLRSAAMWNVRELLDPNNGFDIALPKDDRLMGDLTAPRRKQGSNGKIAIEPKKDIKQRLGRSPDGGDIISMLFSDLIPQKEKKPDTVKPTLLFVRR
jgi:hypothetical protein